MASEVDEEEIPPVPPDPPESLPPFTSVAFEPLHAQLFQNVFKLILEKGLFFNGEKERRESPYEFRSPEELKQEIDFTVMKSGNSPEDVLEILRKVIRFTPHLSHPFYLGKYTSG